MHNVPLSYLIYLLYFKNSQLLSRCELEPRIYDVFDSASALELNPEILTLTPGAPVYIHVYCYTMITLNGHPYRTELSIEKLTDRNPFTS
jgi:hypothetical protein